VIVATSNDETLPTPLPRPSDNLPTPVAKKAPFPSASKWGRLVSSSLGCPPPGSGTGSGNTQTATPTEKKSAETVTDAKATEGGGGGGNAVGTAVKQSRWGRFKSTVSEPPRTSPTHTKVTPTKSASDAVVGSQKTSQSPGVTLHVTAAELNAAKPEAKQPETVGLGELRNELHAVTEQMQRVEARLDVMFRMFTAFISSSGMKVASSPSDMMGVEVVDLTSAVVRRSPDPRSRGNSIDMAAASVFSSRLNSITSEDDVPVNDIPSRHIISVNDIPSNNTISTDVASTLSPPPSKPPMSVSPSKHPPTLVRVRPQPGGQETAAVAAMENPGFIASPDAHPDADPARQSRKSTSGATNAERPQALDAQRTVSAQPATSVCMTTVDATTTSASTTSGLRTFIGSAATSGLTTALTTVSGSTAPVARSSSVHERLSVGHLPVSASAPTAEGIVDRSPSRSSPAPPVRRRSGAGSSPATGKQNDPRLRTTLV